MDKSNIRTSTEDEHKEVIAEMKAIDGFDNELFDNPMVGIFWFNFIKNKLFDVEKINVSDLKDPNNGTIQKLHKNIWQKNYFRAKTKNEALSIYFQDYTQIPRGRIFVKDGKFYVYVGNWINEYKGRKDLREVLTDLISFTFELKDFEFVIDKHWDIGHGWSEHNFNVDA